MIVRGRRQGQRHVGPRAEALFGEDALRVRSRRMDILDARPEFDGKWIWIERTRTEAAQRRPILEAHRLIKEHLLESA